MQRRSNRLLGGAADAKSLVLDTLGVPKSNQFWIWMHENTRYWAARGEPATKSAPSRLALSRGSKMHDIE